MITLAMITHRDGFEWEEKDKIMFDLALFVGSTSYWHCQDVKECKQYAILNQIYQLEKWFNKQLLKEIADKILDDFENIETELKQIFDLYLTGNKLTTTPPNTEEEYSHVD